MDVCVDLMSGLVLIFIILTVAMIYEAARIEETSGDISSRIDEIAWRLSGNSSVIARWNAEFDAPLLEFTYLNPDVLSTAVALT